MSEAGNKDSVQDAKRLPQKVDKAAPSEEKSAQARARSITSNVVSVVIIVMLFVFSHSLAAAIAGGNFEQQQRYLFIIQSIGVVFLIGLLAQISNSYLAGRFARSRPQEATAISGSELAKYLQDLDDLEPEDLAPDYLAPAESEEQRAHSNRMYHIRRSVDVVRKRLRTEIGALGRRGNLNLVIGFITSVLAVVLLAYVSFSASTTAQDWREQIPVYVLRVSVAFFVEIFSFFFLRLYRANLQEIKYFQNELTNVEVRAIALEVALVNDDKDSAKALISELARTERNFVLKKGESTIELELAKAESRGWRDATAAVGKLIRPDRQEQK